jgi:hypothetical protein
MVGLARPPGEEAGHAPPGRPPGERLLGLDIARAVAILGMLVAHYAYLDGTGGRLRWLSSFVNGKAMPLFLLLGGVGLTLLTRRAARPVRAVLGRAAVLLVLGLLLVEHVPLIAVVLHFYAAYFVVGLAIRRLPDAGLLVAAAVTTLLGALTWLYVAPDLPTYAGWEGWGTVGHPWELGSDLLLTGVYPVLPSFAFFAVGMWVGRQRLDRTPVQGRLLAAGLVLVVVGYVLGGAVAREVADGTVLEVRNGRVELVPQVAEDLESRYGSRAGLEAYVQARMDETGKTRREVLADLGRQHEQANDIARPARLFDTTGHGNMPAWILGATGSSLVVVALCLLAAARFPRASRPVALAGQLALTFYVLHAIGLRWWYQGWADELTYVQELVAIAAIFAAFVLAATLWRRHLERGPLEEVLRRAGPTGRS